MLELHPLHHPTIPYVEAGDDPRQQSRGRAGEGRSGRALRSCEPALEQRRAVCARQLGMELAANETHAALLQRHPEQSGAYGAALLERWLAGAKGAPAPALAGSTPGLLPRVVPCLDVLDGRVVKGVQFQHLRDAGDPASQAALYESQ